ncbi:MAG: M48 family metallopeptidase, partial [Desulfarculaceae bacterium]
MNNVLGKSMRFKHTLAAIVLACLTLAAACAVNPVTGQQELSFMSEGQEVALGAQNFPLYTQKMGGKPADDKDLQGYVNNLGRKLAATSHRPNLPWEFNVVNHSSVNAMALPGGKIMVTRGLLNKLNSEDELAFVLGHEIGHVTARHAASQYTNGVLISVAVMGVGAALQGSDYAPLGTAVAGAAGSLLMLSYSRDQERQADELGYTYMVQNNYNPKAMLEVFKIFRSLEKEEPGVIGAMLRSHPLTSERIDYTKNMVDRTKPGLLQRPYQVAGYNQA